jgi:hypothetical protein
MTQDEKVTARERRKLLREFDQLGRDAVRYNLQVGGYGVGQRRDLAFDWLREQEAEANKDEALDTLRRCDRRCRCCHHAARHTRRHQMNAHSAYVGLTLHSAL